MTGASLLVALAADHLLGEASRFHPLVGFGRVASWVEHRCRQSLRAPEVAIDPEGSVSAAKLRRVGSCAWLLLVIVPTALMWLLQTSLSDLAATIIGITVLYFCIGGTSLVEHARAVARPLTDGDLATARQQLSRIVSRDTAQLDAQGVSKATVESVLENGSDALLAPIFWFVFAGAPGVLCYRLSNTLDAMWGYRNQRFLHFGWAAARMDDALNWLPARCCALSYALVGQRELALRCWRTQARLCDSPNAGPVMAAGAGALGIVLGGPASYDGAEHWRPVLGEGSAAQPTDIARALGLVRRATGLWLLAIIVGELLL